MEFVLWLGWVRANKRVVREARARDAHREVSQLSRCFPCGRCASRDVRVRDGRREMVECTRKAELERCVPFIEFFRAHLPSILVAIIYMHASSLAHLPRKMGRGDAREWYTEEYNDCTGASSQPFVSVLPSILRRHQTGLTGTVWQQTSKAPEKRGPRSSRRGDIPMSECAGENIIEVVVR